MTVSPEARGVPFYGIVLTLCALAALIHPVDALSTEVAVGAVGLLSIYWIVIFFGGDDSPDVLAKKYIGLLILTFLLIGFLIVIPAIIHIVHAPVNATHQLATAAELLALILVIALVLCGFEERLVKLSLLPGLTMAPFILSTVLSDSGTPEVTIAVIMAIVVLLAIGRHTLALVLLGLTGALLPITLLMWPFVFAYVLLPRGANPQGLGRHGRLGRLGRLGQTKVHTWPGVTLPGLKPGVSGPGRPLNPLDLKPPALAGGAVISGPGAGFSRPDLEQNLPVDPADILSRPSRPFVGLYCLIPFAAVSAWMIHTSALALSWHSFGSVAVTLPLIILLIRRQCQSNTWQRAIASFATLAFVVSFLNHSLTAPSLTVLSGIAVIGWGVSRNKAGHISFNYVCLFLTIPQVVLLANRTVLVPVADSVLNQNLIVSLVPVVLYALWDALSSSTTGAVPRLSRHDLRYRLLLTLGSFGAVVVGPMIAAVAIRHSKQPWNAVHDVAMQVEQAMKFLVAGHNFYAETYINTPMVHWYSSKALMAALYHTDRLPLGIIGSLPAYLASQSWPGWFDERFIYLPALLICVATLLRLPIAPELRFLGITVILLNQFIVPGLIYGEDDVLVLMFLLLFASGLLKGHRVRAAVWLGLDCATKHTALFMLPIYFIYLYARHRHSGSRAQAMRAMWLEAWPCLVIPVVIVAPFFAWDPQAFLDGNVGYLAGTVAHSYPIRDVGTYGFGALVVLFHFVSSASAYFPFTAFEIVCAIPLIMIIWRAFARGPNVGLLFAGYAVLLFESYFFSRFFQDNGLGYVISVLMLAAVLQGTSEPASPYGPA